MGLFRKIKQYILWIYVCASNSIEIVFSYKELLNPFGETKVLA